MAKESGQTTDADTQAADYMAQPAPEAPATERIAAPALLRSGWVALLFFVLISALFTWPLVANFPNTLPDWADPADTSWRISSIAQQLLNDPFHLYKTRAFYPLENGLALDELLTAQGLLGAPVIWLTGNAPLAFNILHLLGFVLSGFAMWLLVRHLTGSAVAGLVAGMIFAFSPYHYGQYGHLGLISQQWMVFALYFLLRFIEGSGQTKRLLTRRNMFNLGLFSFFFALQALAAGYYAFYTSILVGLYLLYYLLFGSGAVRLLLDRLRRKPRFGDFDWRLVAQQMGLVALAGVVSLAILLPFVLPFLQVKNQYRFKRDLNEVSYWSARPYSLLRTTSYSWLYAPIHETNLIEPSPRPEGEMYPGVSALLLAFAGLLWPLKTRKWPSAYELQTANARWLFAAVALTGLVLGFGPVLRLDDEYAVKPTDMVLPYDWLYTNVPGFDALRVPHRFALLFMLGLAVCAGYGAARLVRWSRERQEGTRNRWLLWPAGLAFLCVAVVSVEFYASGMPVQATGTGNTAPALYRWLSGPEADQVIGKDDLLLELPVGEGDRPLNTSPIYLMYNLSHGRPMLNGSSNIVPTGYDRLFYEMRRFPTAPTLDIIEGLGVKFLVVHTRGLISDEKRSDLEAESRPGGRLETVMSFPDYTGDPRFQDVVYRVKPAPERFAKLREAIPEGVRVYLADFSTERRRLYTTVLPRLIGPNRHYTLRYGTIYDKLVAPAGSIKYAKRPELGDYVVMYKSDDPGPLGFSQDDSLDIGENEYIMVYHKKE
ncbi:MAG: hypothetical protein ABIO92_02285 [Chloroflexia bacterium]